VQLSLAKKRGFFFHRHKSRIIRHLGVREFGAR
jgi:hypothetical protein